MKSKWHQILDIYQDVLQSFSVCVCTFSLVMRPTCLHANKPNMCCYSPAFTALFPLFEHNNNLQTAVLELKIRRQNSFCQSVHHHHLISEVGSFTGVCSPRYVVKTIKNWNQIWCCKYQAMIQTLLLFGIYTLVVPKVFIFIHAAVWCTNCYKVGMEQIQINKSKTSLAWHSLSSVWTFQKRKESKSLLLLLLLVLIMKISFIWSHCAHILASTSCVSFALWCLPLMTH